MAVTYIDYDIQSNVFSTEEGKAIFDEKARIQRWLTIEGILAETQAEIGIISKESARIIQSKAKLEKLDVEKIRQAYRKGKNSIMPVIHALSQACEDGAGDWVHYGVTTQDIVDTGQILELKEVLSIVYRDSRALEEKLLAMTVQHIKTVMIGRTHGQYALPITLGLKIAIWLSELRRHIERLKSLKSRVLVGQLSGAVGHFSVLGEQGKKVSEQTLRKLGLQFSPVAWHVSRDNIAEFCSVIALLITTIAKIANEIFQLSKTDLQEMEESSFDSNVISSSAMPHKNNPVLSQRIIVMSRHILALNSVVMESMMHEHERDPRSLWSEWLSIPQLSIYAMAALENMLKLISNLKIYPEKMNENLKSYGDFIASEHLLLKLSRQLGKNTAQEKLQALTTLASIKKVSFKSCLMDDSEVNALLDDEDFNILDNPCYYRGQSESITKEIINRISEFRKNDNECLI